MIGYNYDEFIGRFCGTEELRLDDAHSRVLTHARQVAADKKAKHAHTKEQKVVPVEWWLVPANCTLKKPPQVSSKQAACFINDKWEIKEKICGLVYDKNTGTPIEVDCLAPLPDNLEKSKPGEYDTWEEGKGWVLDNKKAFAGEIKTFKTTRGLTFSGNISNIEAIKGKLDVAKFCKKSQVCLFDAKGKAHKYLTLSEVSQIIKDLYNNYLELTEKYL